MSRNWKVFMVLVLCALVPSKTVRVDLPDPNSPDEDLTSELSVANGPVLIDVNVLVYIPSSENGSAQIVLSELTMSGENPCLFTIIADEMEQCNKSANTSGPCKPPSEWAEVVVTLYGAVNYGEPYIYNVTVTGGELMLTIYMENKLVIVPKYNPNPTNTTVYLNFMFENFQQIDKNANSSDVVVHVQTLYNAPSPTTTALPSGQSGLCPLDGSALVTLFAVLLFI
ncbi:uncharacterized protein [Engystomops pustulosus]|uniref:uncharacterized protein n=1 Tax=Engystomops pustulosus TaxID=76066 RepID=UPI003AFA7CCB